MKSQNSLFSYDSLRYVMAHLDPLVRFQLSTHCPSLKNLHNLLPLKIENLQITPSTCTVNTTTFKIGIVRKYNDNNRIPNFVVQQNADGGLQYDTDRYGLPPIERAVRGHDELVDYAERVLQELEITRLIDMARMQEDMQMLKLRANNSDPPFTMFFRITITPFWEDPKYIHLVHYKTLQEVKDAWMSKILGTQSTIHVKYLDVRNGLHDRRQAFDLVEYLHHRRDSPTLIKVPYFAFTTRRLNVSKMSINWNAQRALEAIRPVLDDRSPLKLLQISSSHGVIPRDPIIQSAEFLKVTGFLNLETLKDLQNVRVHLEENIPTKGIVRGLVEYWKRSGIRVGTHFSIGCKYVEEVNELCNWFGAVPGATKEVLEGIR